MTATLEVGLSSWGVHCVLLVGFGESDGLMELLMEFGGFLRYDNGCAPCHDFVGSAPSKEMAEESDVWDVDLLDEVNGVFRGCSIFLGNDFNLLPGCFEHTENDVIGGRPVMHIGFLGEPWWDLDVVDDGHWFHVVLIDGIKCCDVGWDEVLGKEGCRGGVNIVTTSHHLHDIDGGNSCNSTHAEECNVVGRFSSFGGWNARDVMKQHCRVELSCCIDEDGGFG